MAIDPEVEEVLTTLIDTVEERVAEVKSLLSEQTGTVQALQARVESLGPGAGGTAGAGPSSAQLHAIADRLDRVDQQLQTLQTQQTQINAFLTGVLKLMMTKKLITQQEMVEVYKATK